jgi:hypothetical protein
MMCISARPSTKLCAEEEQAAKAAAAAVVGVRAAIATALTGAVESGKEKRGVRDSAPEMVLASTKIPDGTGRSSTMSISEKAHTCAHRRHSSQRDKRRHRRPEYTEALPCLHASANIEALQQMVLKLLPMGFSSEQITSCRRCLPCSNLARGGRGAPCGNDRNLHETALKLRRLLPCSHVCSCFHFPNK